MKDAVNYQKTFGGFPASNIYPEQYTSVNTTSETIPDTEERATYQEQVTSAGNTTTPVDKKSIFLGFIVILVIIVLLEKIG